jgi:uncharacterized membrane protein
MSRLVPAVKYLEEDKMNISKKPTWREKNRILVAIYPDLDKAQSVVKRLIDMDYQMDLISVLGRMQAIGDDNLGIYHLGVGERMKAWGKQGAGWGGVWGFLIGAGLFIIPGVGTVAAAGYIVEAIAAGVTAGAGIMAGAAALSQLAIAFHRTGIPEEKIQALHKAIEDGHYLFLLRGAESEVEKWKEILNSADPLELHDLPYSRLIDKD